MCGVFFFWIFLFCFLKELLCLRGSEFEFYLSKVVQMPAA